ncbi:hypothetical protein [Streptosporangium lutulentum]|uniref:Uncharacterized protein n=1 Tax=Streptosporangium lutulentum TaxID=1461250 RepID=A0ABT9QS79_9ACTN|nr:hypothetical protein [Streptosporangium lutulentum]MDP9849541.1 hypothetical protein [Streptosporangium lutulentum]
MAMPKKGTRLITVDGIVYRWRVRHKPTYNQGNSWSPLSFAVERAEEPGGVLVVSLPCARPDNWRGERTIALRPILAGRCIRRAVEQGWNSRKPGSAFTLTVSEDELVALLGEPPQYLIPFLWGMIPEGSGIRDLPRCTQIWSRDKPGTNQAPSDP